MMVYGVDFYGTVKGPIGSFYQEGNKNKKSSLHPRRGNLSTKRLNNSCSKRGFVSLSKDAQMQKNFLPRVIWPLTKDSNMLRFLATGDRITN